MGGNLPDELTPEEAQQLADALRQFAKDLREQMERLMNGEPLSHPRNWKHWVKWSG